MSQYQFGSGNAFGLVTAGAIVVPRKFGTLQEVSVDFSFNVKELYGQYQFPVSVARGQGKITGKAKFASLNGAMVNDLFFSAANATGQNLSAIGEAATVPGVSTYTVTVANAATFKEDLGVTYTATGIPLTRVAPGAEAVGKYSVNVATGVYTFAAADASAAVLIDYGYTATTGNTTTINNLLTGLAPNFALSLPMKYNGKTMYLRLNACVSSKLTLATKLEDFVVPDFDFSAFGDASNTIGTLSLTE
jgi:hypothetical protein